MEAWTDYEWLAGPDFQSVGGLLRLRSETQRWDLPSRTWVTVPGTSLFRSIALGDPMTVEINADEALLLQGRLT